MTDHIAIIDPAFKNGTYCGCIVSLHPSVDDAILVWGGDENTTKIRRVPKHYRVGDAVNWVDAVYGYWPEYELRAKAEVAMPPLKFGL